jgi:hypothetical protein
LAAETKNKLFKKPKKFKLKNKMTLMRSVKPKLNWKRERQVIKKRHRLRQRKRPQLLS